MKMKIELFNSKKHSRIQPPKYHHNSPPSTRHKTFLLLKLLTSVKLIIKSAFMIIKKTFLQAIDKYK